MQSIPVKDAEYTRVTVSRGFEAKVDRETGQIKVDRETGRTHYQGQLVAYSADGAEIMQLTVLAESAPKLTPGQDVTVTNLVAIPWATREGQVRIAYRAEAVNPCGGSGSYASSASSSASGSAKVA